MEKTLENNGQGAADSKYRFRGTVDELDEESEGKSAERLDSPEASQTQASRIEELWQSVPP